MSDKNGNSQKLQVFPMIALVPAGAHHWEFELHGRPTSMGGIAQITRPVKTQMGIPPDFLVRMFVEMANKGLVAQARKIEDKPILNEAGETIGTEPVWETDAEGKVVLYPVNSFFVLVPPPPAAEAAPANRIVAA